MPLLLWNHRRTRLRVIHVRLLLRIHVYHLLPSEIVIFLEPPLIMTILIGPVFHLIVHPFQFQLYVLFEFAHLFLKNAGSRPFQRTVLNSRILSGHLLKVGGDVHQYLAQEITHSVASQLGLTRFHYCLVDGHLSR
jgi:hypothetical protein